MKLIKITINPGEEILEVVTNVLKKKHINAGSIVSIIGAVDSCCISTMPKKNPKEDILTEYHEPLELSGTGEVQNGKPHMHCVLGREKNVAVFGHLHWGKVENWFVNVYILPTE
jgi:predicted DNA-binding protein with PD1-like motif